MGKTSMKAVWKEYVNSFYYGETSLADPTLMHGKGIIIFKDAPNALYECWWVNDNGHGKGRWITNDKHIYEGENSNGKRHG